MKSLITLYKAYINMNVNLKEHTLCKRRFCRPKAAQKSFFYLNFIFIYQELLFREIELLA